METSKSMIVSSFKGSGFNPFTEGEAIISPSQVNVGDLLCEYSIQFNAQNIVRVTRTEFDVANGEHFYGVFVDPKDTSKLRVGSTGEINFWDFEINPHTPACRTLLHRAVPPSMGRPV